MYFQAIRIAKLKINVSKLVSRIGNRDSSLDSPTELNVDAPLG
jgi:hypothetical protein